METLYTIVIALGLILLVVVPYARRYRKKEREAKKLFEELQVSGLHAATTMHPHINALACIGCGACVSSCPEEDVLAVIDGKATLVHGSKCVGHGLCADACPVGAITLLLAAPGRSAELPLLDENLQTTVKGVFIAGELGGLGLIRNAVMQGRRVIEYIVERDEKGGEAYDVVVVGAGPAGITAGLAAKQHGLRYLIVEQGDIGGTILQYPRRKIVMTAPVEIPLWGRVKLSETTKEDLLDLWRRIIEKAKLEIRGNEKVMEISRTGDSITVTTTRGVYTTRNVILALGRRGTPRKLGVPGEHLPKVMYRLIDAATYQQTSVLVVGGGDSAVEAAIGLAIQRTNTVTLSYRGDRFDRIRERNRKHLQECVSDRLLTVVTESTVESIAERSVTLETPQGKKEIPNDFVFVFAGGEMPTALLSKIGIQFRQQVLQ